MGSRAETAKKLLQACTGHFVELRYGVFHELGVIPWGHRRADVVCVNLKGEIIIVEVKSCRADFVSDHKYHEYLPHCHKMYILVPPDSSWIKEHCHDLHLKGIGVLYLCPKTGYIKTMYKAKRRPMTKGNKRKMIYRMCFRSATFTKRNTKRYKVFI